MGGRLLGHGSRRRHVGRPSGLCSNTAVWSVRRRQRSEGEFDLATVVYPRALADVDHAVVRACCGVAETGSVLLTDQDLKVNALAYLAQHLIVLLDPADIVVNIHSAYARPEFRERRYAVFHSGPSATADIEGVLILGAQGVRSLSVLLVPRNSGEFDQAQGGQPGQAVILSDGRKGREETADISGSNSRPRGQGVVTGAEMLSVAAFFEKRHAQAFPSFGSERMGAPVVAFCRMADKEIRLREPILEPDCLIVQDPTLFKVIDVFAGLRDDGYLLVNTNKTYSELHIQQVAERLPKGHAVIVPATESR